MREIEFRIRYRDNTWYYGMPLTRIKNDSVGFQSFDGSYYDLFADAITLGQYTGRTDKNGTKIFEGDIVKGNFPYAEKCVVVWDNKRCGFYLKPITHWGKASTDKYYKLNSCVLEIIGNIYDNTELLEA